MEQNKVFEKKSKQFNWQAYIFMVVGCLFYGASISIFLAPNKIVGGGVSGLSVLLNYIFPSITTGIFIFAINIPIFLIGLKQNGWRFILRAVLTVAVLSLITDGYVYLFNLIGSSPVDVFTNDPLLASIYGGVAQGVGIGCFIKWKVSSGGTELLARVIQRKFSFISIQAWIAILDAMVVVAGAFMHGITNVLYALIVIILSAKVSDIVLMGLNRAKLCYIITEKSEEISEKLIHDSTRGITLLHGTGMYTHTDKGVLMTCVRTRQVPHLKLIVKSIDPKAFLIIGDASEVKGKGWDKIDE